MHQEMVVRVEFPSYYLRDPCAVRHCGHSGVPDQGIDLPVSLEEEVPDLHEEHPAGRGYDEGEESEDEDLDGIPGEELVGLGRGPDGKSYQCGHHVDQRSPCGLRKTSGHSAFL